MNDTIIFPQAFLGKKSASSGFSSLIGILLVIGIVIGLVIVGIFAMGEIVDTSYGNVDVTVHLSGNDVVVSIIGGEDAPRVTGLHVYIDGAPETTSAANYQYSITSRQQIVFNGIALGVVGSRFVVVEAIFDDGTTTVIDYSRLQFN